MKKPTGVNPVGRGLMCLFVPVSGAGLTDRRLERLRMSLGNRKSTWDNGKSQVLYVYTRGGLLRPDVEHFAPGRRCIKVDAIDFYNHGDESISYQILWPVLN